MSVVAAEYDEEWERKDKKDECCVRVNILPCKKEEKKECYEKKEYDKCEKKEKKDECCCCVVVNIYCDCKEEKHKVW